VVHACGTTIPLFASILLLRERRKIGSMYVTRRGKRLSVSWMYADPIPGPRASAQLRVENWGSSGRVPRTPM